jgi:putative DNA primase/helicase
MNAFHGVKFKAFYQGNTVGYDSQSEADLALCNHLAYWANNDVIFTRFCGGVKA